MGDVDVWVWLGDIVGGVGVFVFGGVGFVVDYVVVGDFLFVGVY